MCQTVPVDILAHASALGMAVVAGTRREDGQPLATPEASVRQVVRAAPRTLLSAAVNVVTGGSPLRGLRCSASCFCQPTASGSALTFVTKQ